MRRSATYEAALARQVLHLLPTPVALVDGHGVIHMANQAMLELFRCNGDGMTGRKLSTFIRLPLVDVGMTGGPNVFCVTLCNCSPLVAEAIARDGTTFSLQVKSRPIISQGEAWTIVAARDLTIDRDLQNELSQAITQLSKSKLALQHRNESLERDLENHTQALRLAKDAAEKANLAKTNFLANMSHELRTPLHGILSFSRFGIKQYATASPDRLKVFFERIESAAQTLLKLVNSLLDLSKIEANEVDLECTPVPLNQLVTKALEEFAALVKERSLKLEMSSPEPDIMVWGDELKLAQVVRNLVANAAKFTPREGVIQVTITSDADKAILHVRDTGPGIPDHECEKVFDRFLQSGATGVCVEGTGLGLAICREIVTLHQGTIHAVPTHGFGADLQVTLPLWDSWRDGRRRMISELETTGA